jgi:hypothetical protein
VVIYMLNRIKNACSWLVSQVKAGINWLKNNWPTIQAQAEKIGRWAYGVILNHVRQGVVMFNRGVVTAIETAERRQAMPFRQAFAEAKAVVKAMTDEQVCNYVVYWFCQEPVQAIAV